jgi:hypothetical protein
MEESGGREEAVGSVEEAAEGPMEARSSTERVLRMPKARSATTGVCPDWVMLT